MEKMNLLNQYGHKAEDEEQLRFYQVPKVLFNNPRYKGLSADSKLAYAILRDRQELSKKNGWKDENGYLYFIYTNENLEEILEYGKSKVIRIKKELEKYNLLINHKVGLGKPNRLYILKPNYEDIDTYKNDETIDTIKKSENQTSRSLDIRPQEVCKSDTNDTDISDTDVSDTHSFIQEEKEGKKESIDRDEILSRKAKDILKRSQYEYVDKLYHASIEYAVYQFLFNKNLVIKGEKVISSLLESRLEYLSIEHIDRAINRFEEAKEFSQVHNDSKYFTSCLYESLFSTDIETKGDLVRIGR